ncbi:MAG: hypothetical protein OEZ13_00200 [Spirochaetia bacterium]|nr:hypothetical protein [Spirochaetia bacterium]
MNRLFQKLAFITCIFLLYSSNKLFSQKHGVSLEDELDVSENNSTDSKKSSSVIDKEEIVVEGEDEQIIETTHNGDIIKAPKDTEISEWEEGADKIIKKEKRGVKKIEKRAQIKTEYGLYNTLGVDIYVTKKDDFGLYLLEYARLKKDSEGRKNKSYTDSETSIDNLNLVSHFNINDSYKLMMKIMYDDDLHGLQNESSYSKQFKRGAQLEIQNQFRPSISQKLNISAKGQYIGSDLEEQILPKTNSSFHKAEINGTWHYIFGRRNSFSADMSFWYAEMKTHYADTKQRYRSGSINVWDIFPIYKTYSGENKTPWEISATLGLKTFFANNMNSVFGPYLVFDSFYGDWRSKLIFERTAKIPSSYENFIHQSYSNLTYYEKPEDEWKLSWQNRFSLSKNSALKIEIGYSYFIFYYEPFYMTDGLYEYQNKNFKLLYAEIALDQNFGKDLYYEIGLKAERHHTQVNLRSPLSAYLKSHYTPGTWDIGIELLFTGKRSVIINEITYLKPYTLLNVIIDKKINPTVSFFLKGENLLNQNYVLLPPYKTSGAKGYIGSNILF